jgi:hypothetical protein
MAVFSKNTNSGYIPVYEGLIRITSVLPTREQTCYIVSVRIRGIFADLKKTDLKNIIPMNPQGQSRLEGSSALISIKVFRYMYIPGIRI